MERQEGRDAPTARLFLLQYPTEVAADVNAFLAGGGG